MSQYKGCEIMFSDYIKSVITVTLCAFLCSISCGSACKSSASVKALRLITNLCVFAVIILPLITAFRNIDADSFKIDSGQYTGNNYLDFEKLTENEASKVLKQEIFEKTGITVISISIDISYDNNRVDIEKIKALVSTNQEKNAVTTALSELLGNEILFEVTADESEDN